MAKYSREDVAALAVHMKREQQQVRPIAFLTGAGCSLLADIPLASGLVQRFKVKFPDKDLPEDYGACMAKLSLAERNDVLVPILQAAKVNWAQIALACLLKAGWIGRVLTFNFDNVLARACGLNGLYPAIYDFGVAPANTFDHIVTPSILHLHGQGSGLAMMNSTNEMQAHADKLKPLFDDTMRHMGLVILGYSGGDPSFGALAATASNHNQHWWCSHDEEPAEHVRKLLLSFPPDRHLGGVAADVFLIELARELECFPPVLFTEYEQHLLNELEPVVDFPPDAGGSILVDMRARLQHAIVSKPEKTDFNQLLLEGKWDELVGLEASATSDSEKDAVAWAYTLQGVALADRARAANSPALFTEAGEKYAAALVLKPYSYAALNNWGNALGGQARATGDLTYFIKAEAMYEAAVRIKPDSYEALTNWGGVVADHAKALKDATLFTKAFGKFRAVLAIKPDFQPAHFNWAVALIDSASFTGNSSHFQEAIEKLEAALAIKPDDHDALNYWGIALDGLARATGNLTHFNEAITKLKAALAIKPDFPEALNNWGNALAHIAQVANRSELYIDACEKYDAAIAIKPTYSEAHYNWGNALARRAVAARNLEFFIEAGEKYRAALAIEPNFHGALDHWCIALYAIAKFEPNAKALRKQLMVAHAAEARFRLGSYSLACALTLANCSDKARVQLEQCLASGTLPIAYEMETNEDLASLRALDWFRALLNARRAQEKS